jgi:protein involved in polysaccharide export with SLBB domain
MHELKYATRLYTTLLAAIFAVVLCLAASAQGTPAAPNPQEVPQVSPTVGVNPVVQPSEPQTVQPATDSKSAYPQGAVLGVPANSERNSGVSHEARIGAGDVLDIKVFGLPDLNMDTRVSGSGTLSLPLIGVLPAEGLTTSELEQRIEERLRDGGFVKNPLVAVNFKDFSSSGVSVLGEIARPGIYPIMGARRLFDVVSAAGGMTPRAGHIITITRREQPDRPITVALPSDPAKAFSNNV